MADSHVTVITTIDDARRALDLARRVVDERLAACAQIVGPVRSVYRWDGAIQDDQEWQVWFKSTADRLDELTGFLDRIHPYEVPEVVALPVIGGNPAYLHWVTAETRPSADAPA